MSEKNNIVVVYRSESGFTKNYATWLSEELHCDLRNGKEIRVSDLLPYDTIIYGGGLYAIGINGIKLITKNYEKLKNKRMIVFAVGATPSRPETTREVQRANIPAELLPKIEFFYLRGGFNYNKLKPISKLLMQLKKIQLKKIKNPDADVKGFLASYDNPLDFTNKKNIKPIIDCLGEKSEDEN
jgi:menaquinone-dependent protoporphyrinogen IX oxidase